MDYSRYRRYDSYWELKEALVFRAVEDDLVCQLTTMTHLWHSCSGAPSGFEDDSSRVEFHRKEANKTFRDVGRLRLPWYSRWSQDEGKELVDLWKAFKEEEKDPEYAAYLKERRRIVNEKSQEAAKAVAAMNEIGEDLRREREEYRRKNRRRQRGVRR